MICLLTKNVGAIGGRGPDALFMAKRNYDILLT